MITRKFLTADELVYLWENREKYSTRGFAQKLGCHHQTVGYKLAELNRILVDGQKVPQSRYKAMNQAVEKIIKKLLPPPDDFGKETKFKANKIMIRLVNDNIVRIDMGKYSIEVSAN